jgi:hypothetical protein
MMQEYYHLTMMFGVVTELQYYKSDRELAIAMLYLQSIHS